MRQSSLLNFFSPTSRDTGEGDVQQGAGRGPVLVEQHGWHRIASDLTKEGECMVYEDGEGGTLRYWPSFMPAEQASHLYSHLQGTTQWRPARGREYNTHTNPNPNSSKGPRLQKHYGRGIAGGSRFRCGYRSWPPELWRVKSQVESATQLSFNFLLLNLYRDERDYVSPHTDAGAFLGPNPAIASLSLGAKRRFVLSPAEGTGQEERREGLELELAHGSLLVMEGTTQHGWLHAVPRQRAVASGRINLTFRFVLDEYGDDGAEDSITSYSC